MGTPGAEASTTKFLLLLDDLWNRLDLEKLGVPSSSHSAPSNQPLQSLTEEEEEEEEGAAEATTRSSRPTRPKRKVVFTTRFRRVCTGMQASRRVRVDCLDWEAAWLLFQKSVGENARVINSDERVQSRAVRVAEKCGGLPLALIVIGRAMSAKETWREWEDAIVMMEMLRLPEMWAKEDDPFPLLKISYDHLQDSRTRDCFLSCSLWPEDHRISKDDLILSWMGIGLLDGFDGGFPDAYNKGHAIIEDLKQACLLDQADDDFFGVIRVKVHDVIRGLALWIASEYGTNENRWMVRAGLGLKEALPRGSH